MSSLRSKTFFVAALAFFATFTTSVITTRPVDADDSPRPTLLIADFEGSDYEGWVAEGDAFEKAPVCGYRMSSMGAVFGYHGQKLVNTFVPGVARVRS